jgi:hypothetical protein
MEDQIAMTGTPSPPEQFVRGYLETTGGVWDEIEPQVYDVLLPGDEGPTGAVLRIAFDPEALPDHPGAQLASFGTPFIDGLLDDALRRGRWARLYLVGLNLAPHDLARRVRRAVTLAASLELHVERVRVLHFPQAVFWFQAEFVSDEKEQEIVPVAIDLHYGREVRHLDTLLEPSYLADRPALALPEARHDGSAAAYPLVREQVLRTLTPLANVRNRDLTERLERQAARMKQYYADLRGELEEQRRRARKADEAEARLAERRAAIDREEQLRLTELRRKNTLQVYLRLLQLLLLYQPKLLVHATVRAPDGTAGAVELVWDPLLDAVEAVPCPECRRPTYALDLPRPGQVVCPACAVHLRPGATKDGRKRPRL